MAKAQRHPSTEKLRRDALRRWVKAMEAHKRACDQMRVGMIATYFTDDELVLLAESSFISEHDRQWLRLAGRRPKWPQKSEQR